MAFADTQKLIVDLSLQGNYTPGLRAATAQTTAFGGAAARMESATGRISTATVRLGGRRDGVGLGGRYLLRLDARLAQEMDMVRRLDARVRAKLVQDFLRVGSRRNGDIRDVRLIS